MRTPSISRNQILNQKDHHPYSLSRSGFGDLVPDQQVQLQAQGLCGLERVCLKRVKCRVGAWCARKLYAWLECSALYSLGTCRHCGSHSFVGNMSESKLLSCSGIEMISNLHTRNTSEFCINIEKTDKIVENITEK